MDDIIDVKRLYIICKELIDAGKGDYICACEGGLVSLCDPPTIDNMDKVIIF